MTSTNREILRNILSAVQKTKDLLESPSQIARTTSNPAAQRHIPTLHLPFPDDAVSSLQAKCLPKPIFDTVARRIRDWISDIQDIHITNYNATCSKLIKESPDPTTLALITRLALVYEETYRTQHLFRLKSMLSQYLSRIRDPAETNKKRPTFNVKYTPMLEKYFRVNAYPSASERAMLARKSGMTPRQIEVWFQNHRNRAKKDGCTLPRSTPGHSRICLRTIEQENIDLISSDDRSSLDDELSEVEHVVDESRLTTQDSAHPFSHSAPPHAFPMQYPPSSEYDPFPTFDGRFVFPPPQWQRNPATKVIECGPIDFDGLVASFASKLHLRDGVGRSLKCRTTPWFTATVTIPPVAPHPAFIKLPSLPTITPQRLDYLSVRPVFSSNQGKLPKHHLPRRLPNWTLSATAHVPSSPRSTFSTSRCSSSSSSTTSEELVTPPLSPILHPQEVGLTAEDLSFFNSFFDPQPGYSFNPDFLQPPPLVINNMDNKMQESYPTFLSTLNTNYLVA